MSWMDVALLALGVLLLIGVMWAGFSFVALVFGKRWFESESKKMDEEHEEWRRRHGFPPRR